MRRWREIQYWELKGRWVSGRIGQRSEIMIVTVPNRRMFLSSLVELYVNWSKWNGKTETSAPITSSENSRKTKALVTQAPKNENRENR